MTEVVTDKDRLIDRELARISELHRFLVALTPTNTTQAREEYLSDPSSPPRFQYRELGDLPDLVRDAAVAVDVAGASDPSIRHLFEQKRDELKLQAEMLKARETDEFLPMSIELFGSVRPRLLETAEHILESLPPTRTATRGCLDAASVAASMRKALDRYRSEDTPPVAVVVRDDIAGVMVSNGDVLIGESVSVAPARLDGLVAHEIDTHVLTYLNGARQPLKLMAAGLAGYEETQEGLALISEVVVEGLTRSRLRQLAARVVAVHRRIQDASSVRCTKNSSNSGSARPGRSGSRCGCSVPGASPRTRATSERCRPSPSTSPRTANSTACGWGRSLSPTCRSSTNCGIAAFSFLRHNCRPSSPAVKPVDVSRNSRPRSGFTN
jgi:uncharacterized protein (TIGR02421 family)